MRNLGKRADTSAANTGEIYMHVYSIGEQLAGVILRYAEGSVDRFFANAQNDKYN